MEKDQYWTLIAHYLSEEADQETADQISVLKKESSEFEKQLREASMIWNSSKKNTSAHFFTDSHIETAIDKMGKRLGAKPSEDNNEPKQIKLSFNKKSIFYRSAAAITLLVVSVFALVYLFQYNGIPNVEVATSNGEYKNVDLPDGSKIKLGPDSKVVFPSEFVKNRDVALRGLALFEVEKNPEIPFTVTTENSLTRVLGTSFVVEAYPESTFDKVAVMTGKVAFSNGEGGKKILLVKNEAAILDRDSEKVGRANNLHFELTAWKDSTLAFRKTKVEKVFKTFERHYNVNFDVRDKAILEFTFSADVKNKTLEEALEQMKGVFNFSYKINGKTIIIDQPTQ